MDFMPQNCRVGVVRPRTDLEVIVIDVKKSNST